MTIVKLEVACLLVFVSVNFSILRVTKGVWCARGCASRTTNACLLNLNFGFECVLRAFEFALGEVCFRILESVYLRFEYALFFSHSATFFRRLCDLRS